MSDDTERQTTSDDYEKPMSVSAERRKKLAYLIQEARGAQSLAFLEVTELEATVMAWARVLRGVPDHDLDRAYEIAIRAWSGQRSFGAPDLFRAWREIAERRQYREMKAMLPGDVCAQCQGTGWEPVTDTNGKHQGVKPCTAEVHR